jgi:uncharacterized protein
MGKIIIIFTIIAIAFIGVTSYQFVTNNKTGKTLTNPQKKVIINNKIFTVETVTAEKDKEIGLTKYDSLKEGNGMLFLFDTPNIYTFWMRNMKFPIDIIFIHKDTVVSFAENAKPTKGENVPLYKPESLVDTVLEVNAGIVKRDNIKKGDKVKIEQS